MGSALGWSWAAALSFLAVCLAAPLSAQTVPGAPTGLAATAGNGSVSLTWSPPASDGGSAITSYFIRTSLNGVYVSGTNPGTNLRATISGLTNGSTYSFTVQAQNAMGASAVSNIATATPVGPPYPPTGLTPVVGNAQVALSWVAPTSNGGSPITAYAATSSPGGLGCKTTGALTCTITGLTNGTLYSFTVTATNALGTSSPSAAASATPGAANTVPGAPTGLAASQVTYNGATLSWAAPASNGGSTITKYTVTSSPGAFTCTTTGALSCTVGGLTGKTSYSFSVTATNSVGTGAASAPVNVFTPAPPTVPGPPTGLAAEPGSGSVSLTWSPPASDGGSAITSYFVRTTLNGVYVSGTNPGTNLKATISGLTNGSTYSFTVQAQNAMGAGAASNTATATPSATLSPTPTPTPFPTKTPAPTTTTNCGVAATVMTGGQYLKAGQQLYSPNGKYRFTYQTDANLVLYQGTAALWATGKNFGNPGQAIMQTDGNFVTYDGAGRATWATGTNGYSGAWFAIQDDGNLVVYVGSCKVLWHR